VVIVDDQASMRALIRMVLGALAVDVLECSRGDEAMAAVAAHRPDLVLMDIDMPGLDGIAATREILARFPGLRVAIVTQHEASDLRESAARAGACAYVLKDDLLALRKLLAVPG
jgi:DNA-binding NarL/FixJ family response regulator